MQSGSACGQQRQPPDPFVSPNFFTPCPQSRRLSHRALLWWITLSSSLSCTSRVLSTPPCQVCPSHRPPLDHCELKCRLAWTVDLLSCTFSPNQAVPAHLSPDSLAMEFCRPRNYPHTREVDARDGALVTSTPSAQPWSADFSTLSSLEILHATMFFPTALALKSSALTILLKLLGLDFALARAVSKDPQTFAVHPSNDHSLAANGTTQPKVQLHPRKHSAYLHEGSSATPCSLSHQPIPFAVALSLLLPLIDLGASLKPPCGVQSISPATTRSRCPPHSCT